jgi:glycosyltransferase involved in cell wall biosynthesis
MTTVLLKLATSYICYAPIVRQSFLDHGFPGRKLSVAHNSQTNHFPVRPQVKTGLEKGVLFVGRLREGNQLSLLVRALERIRREDELPLTLHVIGSGEQAELVRKEARERPWIVLHGELFDQERIRAVSLGCFIGCYPGNAGLSVEHLMSLSLPVVTHDDLPSHQGPEPSFIRNGVSGLLYDHNHPEESLYHAIRSLAIDPLLLAKMRQAAFKDYQELVNPPLSDRFWSILEGQHGVPRGEAAASLSLEREPSRAKSAASRMKPRNGVSKSGAIEEPSDSSLPPSKVTG